MSNSTLQAALDWWARRDEMGGFASAGAVLFPGWTPKPSCRAPHREDRSPSFSLYRNSARKWKFKDHSTGEQGGLVDFVMLAGRDGREAARWLMERSDAGYPDPLATQSVNTNNPASRIQYPASVPYRLSDTELRRCVGMAEAIIVNDDALRRFAQARRWQPATLRDLARDGCLGLDDGHLVMIYPTGAKQRLKPLAPASSKNGSHTPKFTWMFGKPDSLWRGDLVLPCTGRVHLTEGETAAISLIDSGYDNGTTQLVMAVPGASCWRDAWAEQFRGLGIVLWPDQDTAGQRLQQRMASSLAPFAARIEVVSPWEKTAACM